MSYQKFQFNTRYDFKEGRKYLNSEPSKTKQSFSQDADINNIMKKYIERGILPDMISANPQYGDFSEVGDYQNALNTVIKANEQFDALPSHLRDKFANEPANFLEFTANPANIEEMYELGLATRPIKDEIAAIPALNKEKA